MRQMDLCVSRTKHYSDKMMHLSSKPIGRRDGCGCPRRCGKKVVPFTKKNRRNRKNPLNERFSATFRRLKTRLCRKKETGFAPGSRYRAAPRYEKGQNAAGGKASKCSIFQTVLGFLIYFTCLGSNCQEHFKKTIQNRAAKSLLLSQKHQTAKSGFKRGKN